MVGGFLLIGIGLLGFPFPTLLGLRLGLVVNVLHLLSGAAALYMGLNSSSLASLRVFCLGLGVLYGLAGLAGLALGAVGNTFTVLPEALPLRSMDHLLHLVLSACFVSAGMMQPLAAAVPRTNPSKRRGTS